MAGPNAAASSELAAGVGGLGQYLPGAEFAAALGKK